MGAPNVHYVPLRRTIDAVKPLANIIFTLCIFKLTRMYFWRWVLTVWGPGKGQNPQIPASENPEDPTIPDQTPGKSRSSS